MMDARAEARRLSQSAIRGKFTPEALHAYTDAKGEALYWRIRARLPDGSKWIRPMRRNGTGCELGEPEFPEGKPLYRLHELTEKPGAPCWYVEGENCADALAKLGVLATTAGSATSDDKADFRLLAGRAVTIWPDMDGPGIEHGERVASQLRALGCIVETIDAAALGLPEGGDCVDWLRAHTGAAAADLAKLPRIRARIERLGADDAWPEPLPIRSQLPPVAAFAFELLPEALRGWIEDICERVQCPPEFPAVGAMVALGSVIGRKVAIRPKQRDDWTEYPNLWGVVIGAPGVLKTPALAEALRPVRALEAKAMEAHRAILAGWQATREAAKVKYATAKLRAREAAKTGKDFDTADLVLGDDEKPQPRRYIVNDCSVEALGEVLRFNSNGVLAYRDEIVGLLKSLDREGMEGARAFYLSAYSGKEPHVFDRIIRGLNLRVEHCCVSMLGSIQPAVVGRYLREALDYGGDDGLVSRFSLLVWPDVSGEWRNVDRWPNTPARKAANELFAWVDDLDPLAIGAETEEGETPFLRLTDPARACFVEWREDFERRQRTSEEHPALVAHFAKYRKLIPALALICHVADRQAGPVSEAAILRALGWAELLESHARRAYASVDQARTESARALLAKIRAGAVDNPLRLRDVYTKGWTSLSSPEDARQAAELLEDLDYLRSERIETAGRPKALYWINPRVRP